MLDLTALSMSLGYTKANDSDEKLPTPVRDREQDKDGGLKDSWPVVHSAG